MAFRTLTTNDQSAVAPLILDYRNNIEEPRFAYGANITCGYAISPRFAIEGGLGYSVLGYQSRYGNLVFGDQIDPDRGFIYTTNDEGIIGATVRYHFQYAELPLRGLLTLGTGRLRSITGLGLTTSFLMKSSSTLILEHLDGSSDRKVGEDIDTYQTVGLFPTVSTGVSYALNDRLELRFEPQARYGLSRIIDAPITAHLWSIGVGFGCMVRI
jgi:Outer membrane protein beta-barrel domain